LSIDAGGSPKLAVDFPADRALDCLQQSNLAQHGYGQTENREVFNLKTNRARAPIGRGLAYS
jgi:hypothetical protein